MTDAQYFVAVLLIACAAVVLIAAFVHIVDPKDWKRHHPLPAALVMAFTLTCILATVRWGWGHDAKVTAVSDDAIIRLVEARR